MPNHEWRRIVSIEALGKRELIDLQTTAGTFIAEGLVSHNSTYVEARFYWKASRLPGLQAYILTHEQAATDKIFGMARRYHDHCPQRYKPKTQAASAKEMVFSALDSSYQVGTAGSRGTGRSGTVQLFHGSELGYWPNAEEHFAGVIQSVPRAPGTEIILESTANGVGNMFHSLWQDAVNGVGDYKPIFVPWFWQKEYRSDSAGMKFDQTERELAKIYGLDDEQLAWRRAKIAELKMKGDVSRTTFQQEYPSSWEESFLLSGRMAFDALKLQALAKECYKPKFRMAYRPKDKRFTEHEEGELRVWQKPKPDTRYVIGSDVAEGLAHGDYSCADVLEKQTGRQVAQWHGHCAADMFGDILHALGVWYNQAYLGVERNNHGLTTLTKLRDLYYPHLHAQRDLEDRGSGDAETKKLGWLTTPKSKPLIIDQLYTEVEQDDTGIVCAETVSEMMAFRVDDMGRFGGQPGCHDDRVMSRAIAGQMLRASYL